MMWATSRPIIWPSDASTTTFKHWRPGSIMIASYRRVFDSNTCVSSVWVGHWRYCIKPVVFSILFASLVRFERAACRSTLRQRLALQTTSIVRWMHCCRLSSVMFTNLCDMQRREWLRIHNSCKDFNCIPCPKL